MYCTAFCTRIYTDFCGAAIFPARHSASASAQNFLSSAIASSPLRLFTPTPLLSLSAQLARNWTREELLYVLYQNSTICWFCQACDWRREKVEKDMRAGFCLAAIDGLG